MEHQDIYDLLDFYFPGADKTYKKYSNIHYYVTYDKICFSFYIRYTRLYLTNLYKCRYSGTENLERLEIFARAINIETISLGDESEFNWGNIKISLFLMKILTKGQSWYNSLGYFSGNHIKESKEWNRIRNLTFLDIKKSLLTLTYPEYEEKSIFRYGLVLFAQYYDIELRDDNFTAVLEDGINFMYENITELDLNNTSIKIVSGYIYLQMKNNVEFDYKKQLSYYLYPTFIYILREFQYTSTSLIKVLN